MSESATGQAAPLVIYGGTFNPIHYGHLRVAEQVYNLLPNAEIALVPCAVPPHRQQPEVAAHHRVTMVQLALAPYPHLTVDAREVERKSTSYTWLTVQELRQIWPQRAIVLVMGDDAFSGLASWHEWRAMMAEVNIIVVARNASGQQEQQQLTETWQLTWCESVAQLQQTPAGGVYRHICPRLEISSSYIREQLQRQQSCRFLMPDTVLSYIEQQGLYTTER
ncbi:MAG: nicotinate-nucleotide adenylyltransferase [Gammaproteobacteria bacterium]|nr:nicotinate-nucleotide adenylyltransferase [Gammaproteobacteria bacterium]NVK88537.1 nicotinate-nucleotide adenylyltransferase [Gammaproteobacteria bacterium]